MEQAPISISTLCASSPNSEASLATLAASPFENPSETHPTPLTYKDSISSPPDMASMTNAETDTTALMTSPPVSPISNTTASHLSSPQSILALPKPQIVQADTDMMASLDAVLARKAGSAQEVTSDYSSSTGGGSDNGQDEDSDMTLNSETTQEHINALSTFDQQQQSPYLAAEHEYAQGNPRDTPQSDADLEHAESDTAMPPTWEQMGLNNLNDIQLREILQNAFNMIQEKEQALDQAAMLGQNLIETNTNLQDKYQRALTQIRHQRMHHPRHLTPPRKILLSPAPELTGGDVVDAEDADGGDENWVDFEPSRSTSMNNSHSTTSSFSSHHHVSFRRNNNHSGIIRSRSRQDVEKMASLEELNSQLQTKVDTITKELKQGRRQAFKRSRKADKELKAVKDELERTTIKVVDLEEQNGRLTEASRMIRMRRIMLKNQLPAPGSIPGSTMATMALEMQGDEMTIQEMLAEDNRIFEELRDRLQSLERKNTALLHQKIEADKKTQLIAQDLADMQKSQDQLSSDLCGYIDLQHAYHEQTAHVKELENTVEELQNTISSMSSRLSQMNSPVMSPSIPSSPIQSLWRREEGGEFGALRTLLHGSAPKSMSLKSPRLKSSQHRPRKTLLSELENEIFRDLKDFNFFGPPRTAEQPQQPIHLGGIHAPKSPKALKDHRHDSESDTFSDAGGKVHGWRERIQDMDSESVCESSSCIRKRRHRFGYTGSDTDGGIGDDHLHGDDSDVDRYQLQQRRRRHPSSCEDDDDFSDCSDPHHLDFRRPSTPGCCCHMYDEYSDYSSYEDEEESVVGWAHFEDHDASSLGYDKRRDGYYLGRRSRRGIFGMIQSVFLLFRFFWRWCRFICILSTALGIAIYRGPDALLTDR
ncbi:hypothetical protein BGX26_006463 [Mortierella sp. AD094]|nr:hypothetical protein BGX26_006463 [Mortierella sp. AD094]